MVNGKVKGGGFQKCVQLNLKGLNGLPVNICYSILVGPRWHLKHFACSRACNEYVQRKRINTHFSNPDTYKQFLEILSNYKSGANNVVANIEEHLRLPPQKDEGKRRIEIKRRNWTVGARLGAGLSGPDQSRTASVFPFQHSRSTIATSIGSRRCVPRTAATYTAEICPSGQSHHATPSTAGFSEKLGRDAALPTGASLATFIDRARLAREILSFLEEGEPMVEFKEILGWDEAIERSALAKDREELYQPPGRPLSILVRPCREELNIRYESYRRLPAEDEMCKSVLIDEWVPRPSASSENSVFIRKKALHLTEEELHDHGDGLRGTSTFGTAALYFPPCFSSDTTSWGEGKELISILSRAFTVLILLAGFAMPSPWRLFGVICESPGVLFSAVCSASRATYCWKPSP
ncbi:hypothetical protein EDB89DRAFT_2247782 [Lactarius sanguifluus]|nr:hypothetical protein EDB89DRAFT_2247782 [Lactarius sanguifluus]